MQTKGAWMSEEFSDDQIRNELKKMVEDLRSKFMDEMGGVVTETAATPGISESQFQSLEEKFERSMAKASLRFQQMIDFIDRR